MLDSDLLYGLGVTTDKGGISAQETIVQAMLGVSRIQNDTQDSSNPILPTRIVFRTSGGTQAPTLPWVCGSGREWYRTRESEWATGCLVGARSRTCV